MNSTTMRLLFWTPRVLVMVFAAFLSVFALDVFSESSGFWETAGALLLHLVPSLMVLGMLVLAWRREWLGAILFVTLALVYVASSWGRFPLVTYLTIAGPLVLVGALFLLSWRLRAAGPAE